MISYVQAVVIGLLQGVTELFPVSSLGHSVLVPAFIGGSWETLVTQSATSTSETSPYLAVIVALHVATALALIVFFRSDWVRIIRGFGRTIRPSIAAIRSSCAVLVDSQNQNREWTYTQQQTVSAEGFAGTAFSPFYGHTIRGGKQTKFCADCHVSASDDNNAKMAQLLMLGTNFTLRLGSGS